MATRRISIGNIGGVWDARVARAGYDAVLDDVNDPKKISFAASRSSYGTISETGSVAAANVFLPFAKTYSDIPMVAPIVNRADQSIYQCLDTFVQPNGSLTTLIYASPYSVLITNNGLTAWRPNAYGTQAPFPVNDAFSFLIIGEG